MQAVENAEKPNARQLVVGLNLALLTALWVDHFYILHIEWTVNAQYEYGWMVPLIGLYLIYLRSLDHPEPEDVPSQNYWLSLCLMAVLLLFIYPIKVLFEANPEWRLLYWADAGMVYGATMLALYSWGGKAWVKHYALAFAMFLHAVPWPSALEKEMVLGLMHMVANITTFIVTLCGIPAEQTGTIIQLPYSKIGIEEACSGVRSLQSTFMFAFFFGELYRFSGTLRIVIIIIGVPVSIFFNLGRTLFLTFAAHYKGTDFMKGTHDAAGYMVAIAAFLLLLTITTLIKRAHGEPKREIEPSETPRYLDKSKWFKPEIAGIITLVYLLNIPAAEAWYRLTEPDVKPQEFDTIVEWDRIPTEVNSKDIPPETRAILRFSEGEQKYWLTNSSQCTAFFFKWEEGMISAMAGVHRPEVCMPSQGFELSDQGEPFVWSRNGFDMTIKPYVFTREQLNLYVYFSVWDNSNHGPSPFALSPLQRLKNAMEGKRIAGRRQLMLAVHGNIDESTARSQFIDFLNKTISVKEVI